jgi:hypothetical protein
VVVSRILDVILAGSDDDTEVGAAVVFGATDDEDETFVPSEVTGRVVEADTELEDAKVFKELGAASGPIADENEDEDKEAGAEEITGPTEDVLEAAGEIDEVKAEVKADESADEKDDGRADWKADGRASGPLDADAM